MEVDYSEQAQNLENLVAQGDYGGAINLLETISDLTVRNDLCGIVLALEGIKLATDRYGKVCTFSSRIKYTLARIGFFRNKTGRGPFIFEDRRGYVHGLEKFIEEVSKNNILKIYWEEMNTTG